MKKVMILAAAAMVFGLVGCSKKVDCKCTVEQYVDGELVSTLDQTIEGVEGDCDDAKVNQTMTGGDMSMEQKVTCKEI